MLITSFLLRMRFHHILEELISVDQTMISSLEKAPRWDVANHQGCQARKILIDQIYLYAALKRPNP